VNIIRVKKIEYVRKDAVYI